jgi:hypothetical protein
VKRLIASALLFFYLCSATEFHEALRLPLLLEHYAEHKVLANDLTFWEFMVMHYRTNTAHDEHDNQLPFKVPGHQFATTAVALLVTKVSLKENTTGTKVNHLSTYSESHFELQLGEIFQPPKM